MNNDITELRGKVTQFENDKLELRRVMLVGQLAQSVQHYKTKQFPAHVFNCALLKKSNQRQKAAQIQMQNKHSQKFQKNLPSVV